MIEVKIDSVRVSLMSQHRVVVLSEEDSERLIPIWIGPFEADAITLQLQGVDMSRPLTHDLLRTVIETVGGEVMYILINGLEKNVYTATIFMDIEGDTVEVDSRPSDAIALAVRVNAPLYVTDDIMESAGMLPEKEITLSDDMEFVEEEDFKETKDDGLSAFSEFVDELDLDSILGDLTD